MPLGEAGNVTLLVKDPTIRLMESQRIFRQRMSFSTPTFYSHSFFI